MASLDVKSLRQYAESLHALKARVAREQAAFGNNAKVLSPSPSRAAQQQQLAAPAAHESTFAAERQAVLDQLDAEDPPIKAASDQGQRAKYRELFAEIEHMSDVITHLHAQQMEAETAWSHQIAELRESLMQRDQRITELQDIERRLLLRIEDGARRENTHDTAVRSASPGQQLREEHGRDVAHLRRLLTETNARCCRLEDDAAQREELLVFQEAEIRRLESETTVAVNRAAEAERSAKALDLAASEREAELLHRLEASERLRDDAEIALIGARATIRGLSASAEDDASAAEGFQEPVASLNDAVAQLRTRCAEMERSRLADVARASDALSKARSAAQDLQEMNDRCSKLEAHVASRTDELRELRSRCEESAHQQSVLRSALEVLQDELSQERDHRATERERLEEDLELRTLRVANLEQELKHAKNATAAAEALVEAQLTAARAAEQQALEAASTANEQKCNALADAQRARQTLQQYREDLEATMADVAALRSARRDAENASSEAATSAAEAVSALRKQLATQSAAALQHRNDAVRLQAELERALKAKDIAAERSAMRVAAIESERNTAVAAVKARVRDMAAQAERTEMENSRLRERLVAAGFGV